MRLRLVVLLALVSAACGGGGSSSALPTAPSSTTPTAATPTPVAATPTTVRYSGAFDGRLVDSNVIGADGVGLACAQTFSQIGTLEMLLQTAANGTITGTATATGSLAFVSSNCGELPGFVGVGGPIPWTASVTGTATSLRFTLEDTGTDVSSAGTLTWRDITTFSGGLSGGVITGTLAISGTSNLTGGLLSMRSVSSMTTTVTLR
jgi:hypothetical protein